MTEILTETFRQAWINQSLEYAPRLTSETDKIRSYLSEQFDDLLELSSWKVANARRLHFYPDDKGVTSENFLETVVHLPGIGSIIAGIRHQACCTEFPFIAVSPLCNPTLLITHKTLVAEVLKETFSVFAPKGFTLMIPTPDKQGSEHKLEVWQQTYYGKYEQLHDKPELNIILADTLTNYDHFAEEYTQWQKNAGSLGAVVNPADREELEESIQQKLCYYGYLNHQWIGIIAGLEKNFFGLEGCLILEEFIFSSYRGQGLAKQIQQLFHNQVSDRFETVWGTIDTANIPSIKTAKACNRSVVLQETFIPL
jgi:RimJ/RimL family protein N-acetyltransferase